jgi:hypothetical protein
MEYIMLAALIGLLIYVFTKAVPQWFNEGYHEKDKKESWSTSRRYQYQNNTFRNQSSDVLKQKGNAFEAYVADLFGKNRGFTLMNWRGDKISNKGIYAVSNMHPDLDVIYEEGTHYMRFAVECKWRSNFINGTIEWAKQHQIVNYKEYERIARVPVYVAIGVGGSPGAPAFLFFIPLYEIERYPVVYQSHLKKFERSTSRLFDFNSKTASLY